MRKLMWFAIGFAASCGLCAYGMSKDWIIPVLALFVFLGAVSLVLSGTWKWLRVCAMAFAGCAVGLCWFLVFWNQYLSVPVAMDGVEQNAVITVTDYSYETDYGIAVDGRISRNGKSYQLRAYLDEVQSLEPGDQVQGTFRIRVTTPDGAEDATYHPGKGIFLLAYQRGDVTTSTPEERPNWTLSAQFRARMVRLLEELLPSDVVGFAKALLLGDTTGLDYRTDTALKVSGIRHVVAVSGLHISILFGLISTLTFRKRYLTALLGLPVLVFFAAVAGFTPSVTRACIMMGLMILATLLEKEYDGPTALAFAVLVLLVANPLAITSVSLQLSAASVAGIFLFRERLHNWTLPFFGKLKKGTAKKALVTWLVGSVSISLSAMSLTTPLCAAYFGMVSLIGPVTNLLTLWIISLVFYGLMALCLLGLVWSAGGAFFGMLLAWPIRLVLWVSGLLARVPMGAVYTQSAYIVAWLIFAYLLLAVFLWQKNKYPRILVCCACLGLCLALTLSWLEPLTDECRVTVLDVGQGQSILLQSQGRTYLVDCGGDREEDTADLIAGTLLSQGIRRLDGIILTHYDTDHAGALPYLLTRLDADLLILPDTVEALTFPADQENVCYVNRDVHLTFGEAEITIFGPIYNGSSNENSLCVLFETENCAILITGDRSDFGERMLLRSHDLPDVDLLIAGHHGSKYSTSQELLQAVTPETVIISVGADNRYGHPHEELLARLAAFGCTVYRTDLQGTILYRR